MPFFGVEGEEGWGVYLQEGPEDRALRGGGLDIGGASLADRGPIVPHEFKALKSGRSHPVNAGFGAALGAQPALKIGKVHVGPVGEHPVEIGGHC